MWISTNYNDNPRLYNLQTFNQLYIKGDCWGFPQIQIYDNFGTYVLGLFDNYDSAYAEFERIREAIKSGVNYLEVGGD